MGGSMKDQFERQGVKSSAAPSAQSSGPGVGSSKVPPQPSGGYFEEPKDPAKPGPLKLYYVQKDVLDTMVQRFDKDGLKMHQLRRFYNHCARIRRRLRSGESDWENEKRDVFGLAIFTASAKGRREDPRQLSRFPGRSRHEDDSFRKGFCGWLHETL